MKIFQKTFSIKEIAEVLGKPKRRILEKAKTEGWPLTKEKSLQGGCFIYKVKILELPAEVQVALGKSRLNLPGESAQSDAPLVRRSSTVRPSSFFRVVQDRLPGWAETIAHARADLVNHFITVRQKAKAKKIKTSAAVKDFLDAYNSALAFPKLHETLGTVSRSTLERWRKDLEENRFDYRVLAPAWGNHRSGRSKLTDKEQEILFSQISHQNRIKIGTAIKVTKYILEQRGTPSPSSPATMRRAVVQFQKQHFDLWTFYREGEKATLDKVLPYIERGDSLIDVGDVLVADGHRCNFHVTHPFTGKPCRPLLVGFYDWKSRVLCGWAIAAEETVQVITAALRAAILRLGKTPKIIYTDNGKAFKSKIFAGGIDLEQSGLLGMFARLDIKTVFAQPYNARAKVIERFFRDFGNQFERYLPSYCGASIPDKPASLMRNEKLMKAFYGETVLEIPQALAALEKWWDFHAWTDHPTLKGKQKGQVFEEGKGAGVDPAQLDFLMMDATVKRIGRNGIRFLGGNYFDEALYGLRDQVTVRYDLQKISDILVYTSSGEFLCRAERMKAVHPMAAHLGEPEDVAELKFQTARSRSLKKQTTKLAREALRSQGNIQPLNALPWNKLEQAAPKLIDVVSKIEAEHEGAETAQHAREITAEDAPQSSPSAQEDAPVVPIFSTQVEYYDHLINKKSLTPDEREWLEDFYETEIGQTLRAMETPRSAQGGETDNA